MGKRFIWPDYKALDNTGAVEPSATLNFYTTGTSTPLAVYSDAALSVVRTQPVTADSNGQFGDIFLQDADYRVVYKDADGTTIWDQDPVENRSLASLPDGTAAAPSLNFQNATDTGWYLDTTVTNDLAASTAGTFRCLISQAGKFLYGTKTPITTANSISGDIQMSGTAGPDTYMSINRFSADTGGPVVNFLKSRATAVGSFAAPSVGDTVGRILGSIDNGSDYTTFGASIDFEVDGGGLVANIKLRPGGDVDRFEFTEVGDLLPTQASATQDLGANLAPNAWQNIYSQNTLTVVSDESFKKEQTPLSTDEMKAFLEAGMSIKKYKRLSPGLVVEDKDENGNPCIGPDGKPCFTQLTEAERTDDQWSVGVVAQEVVAIFAKYNLNAVDDYRVVEVMDDGKLMVKYDHLQCGVLCALANGVTLP